VLAVLQEIPRCVLQLLAVGCILLAAKDLEVGAPLRGPFNSSCFTPFCGGVVKRG